MQIPPLTSPKKAVFCEKSLINVNKIKNYKKIEKTIAFFPFV